MPIYAYRCASCGHELDALLKASDQDSEKLRELMTEVLMAQDFQDLTGQVIRRVIDLVREVEESLINLVKVFGGPVKQGKLLPGSHIPIVAPEAIHHAPPDDLIILPWNIAAEVTAQLAPLRQAGTQFWTACPQMRRL